MAKNKRLASGYEAFDRTKSYSLAEAVKIVKGNARAKFDETVEFSMNLGIDPRHADQMVRGLISLPNGHPGKTLRVGVFARGPEGRGSPRRRRRCGGRRGSRRARPGRRHRLRPLHRDPRT